MIFINLEKNCGVIHYQEKNELRKINVVPALRKVVVKAKKVYLCPLNNKEEYLSNQARV
jgi:hypothetical protein